MLLFVAACGPDEAEVAYEEGAAAFAGGDLAAALEHFNRAIEDDPEHARAHLGRGMVRWQYNQHQEALPDLNMAIALQPDLTLAYFFRGASLIVLRRYEEGIADFDRATASDDLPLQDLVRAHRWRAIGLLNLEHYEEAARAFTQCIDLQPDEPFHRLERGRVYELLGQVEQARADYQKALALSNAEDGITKEVRQRLAALGPAPEAPS